MGKEGKNHNRYVREKDKRNLKGKGSQKKKIINQAHGDESVEGIQQSETGGEPGAVGAP